MSRPAWQTDELDEEWVDHEEAGSVRWQDSVSSRGTSSDLSLTEALPSACAPENTSCVTTSSVAPGTFVVREDAPAVSLLPKTPGHNNKNKMKDFFSPMALERMFEPPSPPKRSADPPIPPTSHRKAVPTIPSRLSKVHYPDESTAEHDPNEIIETDIPGLAAFDPRKPSLNGQFTFSFPQSTPNLSPIPQSTPTTRPRAPNNPPSTDPRLRLFQFQYDTFTREHLSAMVDSIAVNTTSAASNATRTLSAHVSTQGISHMSDAEDESMSRMRSSKRIKLSPAADYVDEELPQTPVPPERPNPRRDYVPPERPNSRRDYVGESRNLMEQIRQARDFSTISTNAPSRVIDRSADESVAHTPAHLVRLRLPSTAQGSVPSSATNTVNSKRSIYSSLGYRQQAADLMAQIKSDMGTTRRLFSNDSELSHVTRIASNGLRREKGPEEGSSQTRELAPQTAAGEDSAHDASNMSIEVWQPQVATTARPPELAIIPATPTDTVTIRQTIQGQHSPLQYNSPSHPPSPIRSGANEDLNRFVSSSTTTGTTLTSRSAGSFVKHAGPKQMRRIGPEDVIGALSDKVGQMVLDRQKMKWVKDIALASSTHAQEREEDEESEDPFRDFESLRDEDSAQPSEQEDENESRIEIVGDADDPEEAVLNSFSFDDSSAAICPVMTGVSRPEDDDSEESGVLIDDPLTDSDESLEDFADCTGQQHEEITDDISLREFPAPPPRSNAVFGTPLSLRPSMTTSAGATPFPSAGRSGTTKSHSVTPVSALKDPNRSKIPAGLKHRRSVSFSDGKRDGPIRGLNSGVVDLSESESGSENLGKGDTGNFFEPSVRSKRIAGLLDGLQDGYEDESPSKASSTRPITDEIQPLSARSSTSSNRSSGGDASRGSLSRSQTHRPAANPDATFLTECSFGLTHDRLVQVITDIQPFEPHWESLKSIDLSKKSIESVARLKEFLPQLDCLSLNDNQLAWLSGVPTTVRTLSIASNMLTDVTSFGHLTNLEHLDLSRNDIESLRQLDCLRNLRELRADGNKIKSVDGLQRLEGLVKLSLQSNQIRNVDLTGFLWSKLEMLNLSQNRLDSIQGLKALGGLIALNLDNNGLRELGLEAGDGGRALSKLRILRVSGNKLQRLDGEFFPSLRTLYADNNALTGISHCGRMKRLENLSLRNQAKGKLSLSLRDVRDIKRLYLSGNPLSCKFVTEACYNLVYFELAACRLTSLPSNFSSLVPNVRVLNLNYNFLEDVGPLEGLSRMKKLSIIGSRVKGTKGLIRMVQRMGEIEMVDFRMNPCTLGWYLPLLVKDVPGALQPSEQDGDRGGRHGENSKAGVNNGNGKHSSWQWEELDAKFRRDLPDEAYVGRLAYRGLIMRACRGVKVLDGIQVSEKEREKAERLLTGILRKRD